MNEIERKAFMMLCDRVEVLEKKVADLEGQVQSQQKEIVKHVEFDEKINKEMMDMLKKGLEAQAGLSKF